MPAHGQSALVIPVPAADALLGSVAARHPGTVREGVPAHVSLLYPLVAASEIDEELTRALSDYRGIYGDVQPHVALALCSSEEMAVAIEQEVSAEPSILAELREAWLVVFQGQWTLRERFEFTAGRLG